jgi:nitronate monooxygenase
MGTRFLASQEADVHPVYKQKVLQAAETDTVYSCLYDDGWPNAPHRTLCNSTLTNGEASGSPPGGARPGEGEGIASWANGMNITRYSPGQSSGLVSRLQSAHDIVKEMADEAIRTLELCVQGLPKDNSF